VPHQFTDPIGAALAIPGQNKDTINCIVRFTFKSTGLIASIVFIIISTLLSLNTIRIPSTRREEIEIMKFAGHQVVYLRAVHFEAALYGIAAVIALVLSYALLWAAAPSRVY